MRYMARCVSPYQKKDTGLSFPCGKCFECRQRRASGWSFRLMQEYKRCESAVFVTLTYDNLHVPLTESGFMTLDKRDFQMFMVRLRKLNPAGIKYYAVGEYGSKTMRPHYHAIMFNVDRESIITAWKAGEDIHMGDVADASVGYTLKYISKPGKIPLHKNDDRIPEFSLMSKGLGSNYVTPEIEEWHQADYMNRLYCPIKDGKKIAMPRYYRTRLFSTDQVMAIGDRIQAEEDEAYRKLSTLEKNLQNDAIIVKAKRYAKKVGSTDVL